MAQAVGPDTDGSIPGSNNGEGIGVLVSRTVGVWNTGTGFEALSQLTAGNQNTATGLRALTNDINGGFNTATGVYSLFSNTSWFFNSATGAYSLANNTDGNYNTANGYAALYRNTVGLYNTATGFAALYRNQRHANTATGYQALFSTPTAMTTRPMVIKLSLATRPASTTQLPEFLRSITTPAVPRISLWALMQVIMSPQPVMLFVSVILVRTTTTAAMSATFSVQRFP
jgi:hypothetical protein